MTDSKEELLKEKQKTEDKLRFVKNNIKALEAAEKGLLRKQRNRRIFTRGGMLEAFLLDPLVLTDDQVYEILKTAFRQPVVDSLLKEKIEDGRKRAEEAESR